MSLESKSFAAFLVCSSDNEIRDPLTLCNYVTELIGRTRERVEVNLDVQLNITYW